LNALGDGSEVGGDVSGKIDSGFEVVHGFFVWLDAVPEHSRRIPAEGGGVPSQRFRHGGGFVLGFVWTELLSERRKRRKGADFFVKRARFVEKTAVFPERADGESATAQASFDGTSLRFTFGIPRGVMAVGAVTLFIIGTALGSKTRRDANES